jgi:Arc/MetJ-type ribon-helix-helix transcriptional regulator
MTILQEQIHAGFASLWPGRSGDIMKNIDFSAPAELFPSRNRKVASKVRYRRFDKASEAIRFAVEELPEAQLLGAYIEINEARLSHQDIRALYESEAYPLKRAVNA